jgi:biotin carboxylase
VNMALCFPGNFEPQTVAEATDLMQEAARALGLERTPFHCECIVGPRGVELIEMAARGGGGHIFTVLYEPTTGVAGIVRQARLLLGEPVDPLPSGSLRGSCYRFLSAPEGIVERIEGLAEASKMPGVVDFGVAIEPGQRGGPVTHGNARHGHVCTMGSDRAEAVALADAAASRVRFVMQKS